MKPYVILNAAMTLDGKIATIQKQEVLKFQEKKILNVFMKSERKLMESWLELEPFLLMTQDLPFIR